MTSKHLFSFLGEKSISSVLHFVSLSLFLFFFLLLFSLILNCCFLFKGNIFDFNNRFMTKAQLPGLTQGRAWRRGGMLQKRSWWKGTLFGGCLPELFKCVCARVRVYEKRERDLHDNWPGQSVFSAIILAGISAAKGHMKELWEAQQVLDAKRLVFW